MRGTDVRAKRIPEITLEQSGESGDFIGITQSISWELYATRREPTRAKIVVTVYGYSTSPDAYFYLKCVFRSWSMGLSSDVIGPKSQVRELNNRQAMGKSARHGNLVKVD